MASSLQLPDPVAGLVPAFRDKAGAKAWLAGQPRAQALHMAVVLAEQVQALDASDLPVAERLLLLEVLRAAIFPAESGVEARYVRKPLPLPAEDAEVFRITRQLWRSLAVAYLRLVPLLSHDQVALPLHRAVTALRLEQFAHFQAAQDVPAEIHELLYGILLQAESTGALRSPVADPHLKFLGDSDIASDVSWAFLLAAIDPYHLSAAQLAVSNRAFSRWRSLSAFQSQPGDDAKAIVVPLARILGEKALVDSGPHFLDVRPVIRKIRKRIEALEAGQAPEELKLGRELSGSACIRLLRDVDSCLRFGLEKPGLTAGPLALTFGLEHIYLLLGGTPLNPAPRGRAMSSVDHQRMALFGFDTLSAPPAGLVRPEVPSESWSVVGGELSRSAVGSRILAPCLVASRSREGGVARLGVLSALRCMSDGTLRGHLHWFAGAVSCALLPTPQQMPKVPMFVLAASEGLSVILPASARVRPGVDLGAAGAGGACLCLGEVLERGSDFVRYAGELR